MWDVAGLVVHLKVHSGKMWKDVERSSTAKLPIAAAATISDFGAIGFGFPFPTCGADSGVGMFRQRSADSLTPGCGVPYGNLCATPWAEAIRKFLEMLKSSLAAT